MKPSRGLGASIPAVLAAALLSLPAAHAGFQSAPVATREQLPAYLIYLLPVPETAELTKKGEWKITVATSLSNSFIGTDGFRSMSSPIPGERLTVDQALVDSYLAANPGDDLFFIDGEVLRSALRIAWGASDRVELGLEIPLIRYSGGILDPLIENFHENFGFPDDGRANYQREAFNVVLYLGGSEFLFTNPSNKLGVGDITFSAKTRLYRSAETGATIAGSAYLKFPTGSEEDLFGSGSADFGFQAHFTREWKRHAMHLGLGAVHLGSWDLVPGIDPEDYIFGSGSYEFLMTEIWSLLAQLGITASPYRDITTDDLADPSIRFNAGFRWRFASGLTMEGLIEENLTRTNANADFGIFFGLNFGF